MVDAVSRVRACRERRRDGIVLARMEVDTELIAALVDQGHLGADARTDAAAVGHALAMVARQALRRDVDRGQPPEHVAPPAQAASVPVYRSLGHPDGDPRRFLRRG